MQPTAGNPKVEPLAVLIGEWAVEASHPQLGEEVLTGRTTFEWVDGGHFLVQRSHVDHPDVPDNMCVIGAPAEGLTMHYFDSRGVYRLYDVSLADGALSIWRDAPGFSQRFTGTFGDGDKTITGLWELSRDGETWADDLRIDYRRISG